MARKRKAGDKASAVQAGGTFSIIGVDVVITGDISATADLHIEGTIDGDVRCASLVQGAGSTITGCVVAQSARLGGKIEGSIEAVDLVIEAGAEIRGDVTYANLTVAPGGRVDGAFRHQSADDDMAAPASNGADAPGLNNSSESDPVDSNRDIGALRA